jgi:hypothetical protein
LISFSQGFDFRFFPLRRFHGHTGQQIGFFAAFVVRFAARLLPY